VSPSMPGRLGERDGEANCRICVTASVERSIPAIELPIVRTDPRSAAWQTLALGPYVYGVYPNWGHVPNGFEIRGVSAAAADSSDRLFVFQRASPPVLIFDPDGEYVDSWGTDLVNDPHGIFISDGDFVYLIDRDSHRVVKCTSRGEVVMKIGSGAAPYGRPFNHPTDLAVAPNGELFVTDGYGNNHVHRFSEDGELIESWGRGGGGLGELSLPHAIAIDHEGIVYVADRENDRLQLFTPEGAVITQWTGFHRPTDLYMDREGQIFVSDLGTRVHVFDSKGNRIGGGRSGSMGHGICGDSKGSLYILAVSRGIEKWIRTERDGK
jgi:DNA-binding beta-propeller fold protein YncE